MAGKEEVTPEQRLDAERKELDTTFARWLVYRGGLEQRLEIGLVRGKTKTLADYFKAVDFADQEGLRPVTQTIVVHRGEQEITLELDSSHPKTKSTKKISVTEWLEQAAIASAKMNFLAGSEDVPYPIQKAAEKKNRAFVATVHEALQIVRKEGRVVLTRKDIERIFPETGTSRRKFIGWAAAAGVSFLAACAGLKIVGPDISPRQTQTPRPGETASWTPEPPDIVEPSDTPTTEATSTPEIAAADPTNIESWPAWAQDFFRMHPEDTSQDTRFQEFMDLSRRQYLATAGITGVETMNSQDLMWAMIRQRATEQGAIILTPAEIIAIAQDEGAAILPSTTNQSMVGGGAYNPDHPQQYHMWYTQLRFKSGGVINTPLYSITAQHLH